MGHATSIRLKDKEQQIILADLAASLGLFQTRGVGTGSVGSVSELCKALADGRLTVIESGERCTGQE